MTKMIVHVFGNPDLAMDSLPPLLLPELQKEFPAIEFRMLDPNEEWDIPDPFMLIDTVVGIPNVRVFRSLDEFDAAPTVSVHDFDALFNLRYLKKLGKLKTVFIIGIPPATEKRIETADVVSALRELCSDTAMPNSP